MEQRCSWSSKNNDGSFTCQLCPHCCVLREGQRGICYGRIGAEHGIVLDTYSMTTSLSPDPVEKKPLRHFHPGSQVLSFGSLGCNLGCSFCQNWHLSSAGKAGTPQLRLKHHSPEQIIQAAFDADCRGVAFTYNEPIVSYEFVLEVARLCRERGLVTVAVSAGYINPEPRREFFGAMDAANIDLKGFTEDFYRTYCHARLQPVLDTLLYLARETKVWLEITCLLIPGANDSVKEIDGMTRWIVENLGPDVPLHLSAFHPDYKLLDRAATEPSLVFAARQIAIQNGLRHVYTGNI